MLKLQNIECGYGRIKVLEGINFEVGAESVGLLVQTEQAKLQHFI